MLNAKSETLLKFARTAVFKKNHFWMVNLLCFKKDSKGSIETSVSLYESYISEFMKLFNSSNKPTQILKSYTLHSIFSTTGPWDCCIIMEYNNAKHFVDVISTKDYQKIHQYLSNSVEATEIVAVSMPMYPDMVDPSSQPKDGLWRDKIRENPQDDKSDPQNIKPNMNLLLKMMKDTRPSWKKGQTKPIWALNLLKFIRPAGKDSYMQYGKIVSKVVKQGQGPSGKKEGDGIIVVGEAITLLGKVSWDQFAIMGYSSLAAFIGLGKNKEWQKAETQYREKGLKKQGLVLIVPERTSVSQFKNKAIGKL